MCYVFTNLKRIAYLVIVFAYLGLMPFQNIECVAYAKTESNIESEFGDSIDNTLNNIDSSGLDEFLGDGEFNGLFEAITFNDLVRLVLSGELFTDYNSLVNVIVTSAKNYFTSTLKLIIVLLVIILLYKLFETFCADKFVDIKKLVRMIFTLVIVFLVVSLLKNLSSEVRETVLKIFRFCEILFPIILSLVLTSGANVSFASYNSLSVVLLETGSYLFVYVLIPLAVSIMVFSLASFIFSKGSLTNITELLKSIFKHLIIIMVAVFGLFSSMSVISSGMKDGMSLRLTKYAIKNYVPVLGGYISEGFDIVKSSAVIIKNAFGLCGILILFFNLLSPLITYFVLMFSFKILSIIVAALNEEKFASVFNGVSKAVSYFIAVLCGLLLIFVIFLYMIILSVSVV